METFTLVFLCALALGTLLETWLSWRQARHVSAHRDRVPDAFADRVSPDAHRKAADYTLAKIRFGRIELGAEVIFLLIWTLGGGLDLLHTFWQERLPDPVAGGIAFMLSFLVISGALGLPFGLWRTFGIESRFGFNRTSAKRFFLDLALETLLVVAIGGPLLWVILSLMTGAGSLWWLYAWAVWMGFTLILTWAFPVFIAPLFNRFTPLEDTTLTQRIEGLLDRCGFASKGVFVMDGSRRSTHGNAYFSGFGKNKRIVFFDTLLGTLAPVEVEAVLAHELGHFRLRHVAKRLASGAAMSLAGLGILSWLMLQPWFYTGLGVSEPSPAVALALFFLAAPVFSIFLTPVGSLLQRRHEYEADAYAASQTSADALRSALVKLYRDNASTLTPDPLYSAFHDSHPPAPLRIQRISQDLATTNPC